MDLSPFNMINPCGFTGLRVTQITDHAEVENINDIAELLIDTLCKQLNYK